MSFSITSLLMHSPDVPTNVREALRAAADAEPEDRPDQLKVAAKLLFQEVDLPCADARELVGLPSNDLGC